MKKTSYFWVGFSDLMTSLFFIMLVLFAITLVSKLKDQKKVEGFDSAKEKLEALEQQLAVLLQNNQKLEADNKQLITDKEKFEAIQNVEKALSTLDRTYYTFDDKNKRYKLNIDAQFPPNESDIDLLAQEDKNALLQAGRELHEKISHLLGEHRGIEYLLIIEGNTQQSGNNYIVSPNVGYKLSYERALALFNFWKKNGIDFNDYNIKNHCEVIIAGSGYFGQSREATEWHNRRFSIQVTSKVGKFLQNK